MLLTFDLSAPLLDHTGCAASDSCVNLSLGNWCAQGRAESGINARPRNESATGYCLDFVRFISLPTLLCASVSVAVLSLFLIFIIFLSLVLHFIWSKNADIPALFLWSTFRRRLRAQSLALASKNLASSFKVTYKVNTPSPGGSFLSEDGVNLRGSPIRACASAGVPSAASLFIPENSMLSTDAVAALRWVSPTSTCYPEGLYFLMPKEVCCDLPRSNWTLREGRWTLQRGTKWLANGSPGMWTRDKNNRFGPICWAAQPLNCPDVLLSFWLNCSQEGLVLSRGVDSDL